MTNMQNGKRDWPAIAGVILIVIGMIVGSLYAILLMIWESARDQELARQAGNADIRAFIEQVRKNNNEDYKRLDESIKRLFEHSERNRDRTNENVDHLREMIVTYIIGRSVSKAIKDAAEAKGKNDVP